MTKLDYTKFWRAKKYKSIKFKAKELATEILKLVGTDYKDLNRKEKEKIIKNIFGNPEMQYNNLDFKEAVEIGNKRLQVMKEESI